jgi:hypothetical protein
LLAASIAPPDKICHALPAYVAARRSEAEVDPRLTEP